MVFALSILCRNLRHNVFGGGVRVFDKWGARGMSSLVHYDVHSVCPHGCPEQLAHLRLVLNFC